jgi:hypothetical protein
MTVLFGGCAKSGDSEIILGCGHFLLDKVPLFRYETIAREQWYAHSKKATQVLWSRV